MKPTISKSAVMKRAWYLFKHQRCYFSTFSQALIRAWKVEKELALNAIINTEVEANKKRGILPIAKPLNCYDYYNGVGSARRYFGD
jgi:hypothetical protein